MKSGWSGGPPPPKFGLVTGWPKPQGRAAGKAGARGAKRGRWSDEPDSRTARSPSLIGSRLVDVTGVTPPAREMLIVATVVRHPWLLEDHAETFAAIDLQSPDLRALRDAVLTVLAEAHDSPCGLDSVRMTTQLARSGAALPLSQIDTCLTHRSDKFAGASADRPTVEAGWLDAVRLHRRACELMRALRAAEAAFLETQLDDDLERIRELQRELSDASVPEAGPD